MAVGSKTYDGVRFSVYPHDHLPPHVHGMTAGAVVIVDLLPDGEVTLSSRKDAIDPANAKRSDVAKVLKTAGRHVDELIALWEKTHGTR